MHIYYLTASVVRKCSEAHSILGSGSLIRCNQSVLSGFTGGGLASKLRQWLSAGVSPRRTTGQRLQRLATWASPRSS